ncbi:helix-turn-helix domain-containing protein [Clostridium algidicarnis]|uniref:helix-turn-helix domain-containing protein n=1 Tax=Clostridium algidicarnis TaxID=37659 RepID=UPI001C0DCF0D|nr:helix-turn-helix transcriptional regulator [Clostridium algidicarnis]MBU3205605.1 helix-turn-helix domain-containing protein [Clostridium algidicarnis]MBU3208719.1 helix-turn-helix domain-containing protein [Clostridium algidicarnis]
MSELCIILKELREAKGVSMDKMCEDLSKLYGVSLAKSTISKWENGKAEPTLAYARILSKYFDVTLDYIIGVSNEKQKPKKQNQIETIAAHFEGEEFTEDDKEDIENFIKYVLSKKKK